MRHYDLKCLISIGSTKEQHCLDTRPFIEEKSLPPIAAFEHSNHDKIIQQLMFVLHSASKDELLYQIAHELWVKHSSPCC